VKKRITFVGLDTHKNFIEAALADDGRSTEVRLYGSIGGDLASLGKMIRKLLRQEPGAVAPHAGIRAGGAGKPPFLPRPFLPHAQKLIITRK
jgi:hypothetical protein